MIDKWIHGMQPVRYKMWNRPRSSGEMKQTQDALMNLFVNRNDAYAMQEKNKRGVSWVAVKHGLTERGIRRHIKGDATYGAYQINEMDRLKWACFDIDDHQNVGDSKEKVQKIIDIMDKYCIPFVLEASGSPGSYHVWVFLVSCATRNAYLFSRMIAEEAGVNCEIYPKQRSLVGMSLGNQVKIPLGINLKNEERSRFIGRNFEPIESIVVSFLIELTYIPEPEKVISHEVSSIHKRLTPCQKSVLDDGIQLIGSEGHLMRLSIAYNAIKSGMKDDDIVALFARQDDFDEEFTRKKVRELRNREYVFRCQWIQNNCWELVKNRCPNCKGEL